MNKTVRASIIAIPICIVAALLVGGGFLAYLKITENTYYYITAQHDEHFSVQSQQTAPKWPDGISNVKITAKNLQTDETDEVITPLTVRPLTALQNPTSI